MAAIGYVRVSTNDQSLSLQKDAMKQAGVEKVFEDEGVSGTLASRPGLDNARAYLREGDQLVVWKLDRLGRSTRNVLALIDELEGRGIGFRSLTEGIDTRGSFGKAMLTVLAAFAQLERDQISERTKAGLEAARAQGRVGGRPKVLNSKKVQLVRHMHDSGMYTVQEIAKELEVGRATVYRYLNDSVALGKSSSTEESSLS